MGHVQSFVMSMSASAVWKGLRFYDIALQKLDMSCQTGFEKALFQTSCLERINKR